MSYKKHKCCCRDRVWETCLFRGVQRIQRVGSLYVALWWTHSGCRTSWRGIQTYVLITENYIALISALSIVNTLILICVPIDWGHVTFVKPLTDITMFVCLNRTRPTNQILITQSLSKKKNSRGYLGLISRSRIE